MLKGGELRANPSSTHHSHELRRQRDATKELHQKESAAWEEEQKQLIEKIEAQELVLSEGEALLIPESPPPSAPSGLFWSRHFISISISLYIWGASLASPPFGLFLSAALSFVCVVCRFLCFLLSTSRKYPS